MRATMTDLTLYHNPRCSKSRGALELLEARGLQPVEIKAEHGNSV